LFINGNSLLNKALDLLPKLKRSDGGKTFRKRKITRALIINRKIMNLRLYN